MRSGFTLIELLIVVAIIGILATALVPNLTGTQARARDTQRIAYIKDAIAAAEVYQIDYFTYPSGSGCATTVLAPSYTKPDFLPVEDAASALAGTICGTNVHYQRLADGYLITVPLENDRQANSCFGQAVSFSATDLKSDVSGDDENLFQESPDCGDGYAPAYTVVR